MQKFVASVMLAFSAVTTSYAAIAEPASLAGAWSGGGTVTFGTGNSEHARCRAVYSPVSKNSYSVSATCATASGKVSQSATVHGNGSRFSGSFYNAEWDASGSISVSVNGRSQTVRLSGTKGSAVLSLSR